MSILKEVGLDTIHYNTHSFRIGVATSAKSAGLTESQIKSMSHWKSDAYCHYIKPSSSQLASFSNLLVSQNAEPNKHPRVFPSKQGASYYYIEAVQA